MMGIEIRLNLRNCDDDDDDNDDDSIPGEDGVLQDCKNASVMVMRVVLHIRGSDVGRGTLATLNISI